MERNKRKVLEGVVTSNKMNKTVTVRIVRHFHHPRYGKLMQGWTKFYAHDESDQVEVGQKVRICECKPLSKLKRWRVMEVVQHSEK